MMIPTVEKTHPLSDKLERLAAVAETYNVTRLELFGSFAKDSSNPKSDVDLLVSFQEMVPRDYADAYFGLQEELEELMDRPVDLVELQAIDNPYFLKVIEKERIPIYVR